jgi:hypothetical protein
MESQSNLFRLRAISSEQRAAKCTDPDAKLEWTELANQWHALAGAHESKASDENDIDFA